MSLTDWRDVDQSHLLQKIFLLQLLNNIPEKPSLIDLSDRNAQMDCLPKRVLSLQREKELAESFAFLAATTDDPRKVVAACVEETAVGRGLTVRLAVNNGGLDQVKGGFERMARVLERVARAGQSSSRLAVTVSTPN